MLYLMDFLSGTDALGLREGVSGGERGVDMCVYNWCISLYLSNRLPGSPSVLIIGWWIYNPGA